MIPYQCKSALIFLAAASIFLSACGGSKKLADKTMPEGSTLPIAAIKPEAYYQQGINYKSFIGKANMQYQDEKMNQKLISNLKINNNKNIWAQVAAMGGIVEVARAYITPDSLKALLPMNKTAYEMGYQEGLNMIQADLDFSTLQNLFLGNPLITGSKNYTAVAKNSEVHIDLKNGDYDLTIIYDSATQLIKEQLITNKSKDFSCRIQQSNYKPFADKQPFAFERKWDISNKGKKMNLNLEFTKAEIDIPAEVNFRIPESYSIQTIK